MYNDRDNTIIKKKHSKNLVMELIIGMKVHYHIHLIDFM